LECLLKFFLHEFSSPLENLQSYQSIVSRNIDPQDTSVITFGTINGGEALNAVANHVYMTGSVRIFDLKIMKFIKTRMLDINQGLEKMFGVKIEFDHKTLGQHVDINKGNNDKLRKKDTELHGMYGFHYSIQSSDNYWKIFPNINGKVLEFTSDDEFFEGKKDYLILSFENE